MGDCIYCNKPAGMFKNKHQECVNKHNQGLNDILTDFEDSLETESPMTDLISHAKEIAENCYIDKETLSKTLRRGWRLAIDKAFDDGILTEQEEERMKEMAVALGYTQEKLNKDKGFIQLVQGSILRDIMNGNIPSKFEISGDLPFNFKKDEKLVWIFSDVEYSEMKTIKQFVGGSQGISVRIAKGIYYKTSTFKGQQVESNAIMPVDSGIAAITDKNIYFTGAIKSFRTPYNKIMTIMPYDDGVGFQKDTQTAKPQIFKVGNGWFIYNLIRNLMELSK